jgi:hypothetical protein
MPTAPVPPASRRADLADGSGSTPGDVLAGLFTPHDPPQKLTPGEEIVRGVFWDDDLDPIEPEPLAASPTDNKAPVPVVVNINTPGPVIVDARPPQPAEEVSIGPKGVTMKAGPGASPVFKTLLVGAGVAVF